MAVNRLGIARRPKTPKRLRGLNGHGPEYRSILGQWHRIDFGASAGETLIPPTLSGAMAVAAAYSAIFRLASDVALLTMNLYRGRRNQSSLVAEDDPYHEITAVSPDGGMTTAYDFRQTMGAQVLGWGRSFARIHYLDSGLPVELELLEPTDVEPQRRERDRTLYFEMKQGRTLRWDEVLWLRGLSLGGLDCLSPVRHHRNTFDLSAQASEFGRSLFTNSSVPRGVLESPKWLGKEGRENLRASMAEAHSGPAGWNNLAVLEDGVKFVKTGLDPDDAQFLATREFQVLEICRIFSIPPNKLMDFTHANLANIEQSNLDYLQTSLMTWVKKWEDECNAKLLTRRERRRWRYAADVNALLRADLKSRAEWWESLRRNGVVTAAQIAASEGLPPVSDSDGGNKYIVPVNMTEQSRIGERLDAGAGTFPAPAEGDGGTDDDTAEG